MDYLKLYDILRRYKIITAITIAMSVSAVVIAFIFNFALSDTLSAYRISSLIILASEILQIISASVSRRKAKRYEPNREFSEDNNRFWENKKIVRSKILRSVLAMTLCNLTAAVFCAIFIPPHPCPDPVTQIRLRTVLLYGTFYAGIIFIFFGGIYVLFIRNSLIKRELIYFREPESAVISKGNTLLLKIIALSALLISIVANILIVKFSHKYNFPRLDTVSLALTPTINIFFSTIMYLAFKKKPQKNKGQ